MDEFDEEDYDEIDEESEEIEDDLDESSNSRRDLSELEELGSLDGQQDAISGTFYTGYGLSVDDLDSLSDEERDAYEAGYHTGFNAGGGFSR